jgi:hypothetical protein
VTIHAGGRRRDVREPGFFHAGVAIAAVDPQLSGMGGMGKGDGLNGLIADPRVLWCEIIPDSRRLLSSPATGWSTLGRSLTSILC